MLQQLRQWQPVQRLFAFNQFERDQWVASQAMNIPAGSGVLDIGAGSCPYRHLFRHCDYKTHDFQQLQSDQLLGKQGYGSIDYVSDITAIPVPQESFDVILCTEVLEHVPEPIEAVKEFARILKPDGRLLLTAPLGSGLHQEPYHFYGGYTPHWYQKFLVEAGFERVTVQPNGGFYTHFAQESIRFALFLVPWRSWRHLIFMPLWLLMLPWCIIVAPLVARPLDHLDATKSFTVGYFVTARKSG